MNIGCIPSKALLQSSEQFAFLQNDAKEHGLLFKDLSFDFLQMQKRKFEVVLSLVNGVAGLFKQHKVDTVEGTAKFISPEKVEVTGAKEKTEVKAKSFILATGSEPIALPFLPFDEKIVLSSTGALNLQQPPKKLLMIGAGVIGVELASVYRRLGSEVVIVEMLEMICPGIDQAISKILLQSLKKQGIVFHLGAKVTGAKIDKSQVILNVEIAGKAEQFTGDAVLVAVGRRPYSTGLGLENIGIELTPRGFVPVDQLFRTVQPNIYAIGDLIEGVMLAHKASEEGVAVAEILAGKKPLINYVSIPNVVYTHPEVACAGLTEEEAKAFGFELLIGKSFFKGNGRARCIGFTEGMVKIIADKATARLLGMHIIGPYASEMIGEGVIALNKKATLSDIIYASHAHPTLSETILEAAKQAMTH